MVECDNCGLCQWHRCQFDADYTLRDVTVSRGGTLIQIGDLDLCGGHLKRAKRLGRLELDWDRVLKASNP